MDEPTDFVMDALRKDLLLLVFKFVFVFVAGRTSLVVILLLMDCCCSGNVSIGG